MPRRVAILLIATLSAGCQTHPKGAGTDRVDGPIIVVREVHDRQGGTVTVSLEGSTLHVDAISPSGIGGARLVLESGAWPRKVVVHLQYAPGRPFIYLEGPGASLENGRAKADESPTSLTVHRLGKDGFEAQLPRSEMKVLRLHWVDAYR